MTKALTIKTCSLRRADLSRSSANCSTVTPGKKATGSPQGSPLSQETFLNFCTNKSRMHSCSLPLPSPPREEPYWGNSPTPFIRSRRGGVTALRKGSWGEDKQKGVVWTSRFRGPAGTFGHRKLLASGPNVPGSLALLTYSWAGYFPSLALSFLVHEKWGLAQGSISQTGLMSALEMLTDVGCLCRLDNATFYSEAPPCIWVH